MSIKLLACVTVLLLVGAVLPFCLGPKSPTGDPTTAADALSSVATQARAIRDDERLCANRSGGRKRRKLFGGTGFRNFRSTPAAGSPAIGGSRPARAAATPDCCWITHAPPSTSGEARPAIPPQTVATTLSSLWAPPADAGQPPQRPGESPTANANQAAAARSPEYEANARGHRPGEPPAAQFDGTIEGPKR